MKVNNTFKFSIAKIQNIYENFYAESNKDVHFMIYKTRETHSKSSEINMTEITNDLDRLKRLMVDYNATTVITFTITSGFMVVTQPGEGESNRMIRSDWNFHFPLWLLEKDLITRKTYLHFVKTELSRFKLK